MRLQLWGATKGQSNVAPPPFQPGGVRNILPCHVALREATEARAAESAVGVSLSLLQQGTEVPLFQSCQEVSLSPLNPASMIPAALYTDVGRRGREALRWGRLARKPPSPEMQDGRGSAWLEAEGRQGTVRRTEEPRAERVLGNEGGGGRPGPRALPFFPSTTAGVSQPPARLSPDAQAVINIYFAHPHTQLENGFMPGEE